MFSGVCRKQRENLAMSLVLVDGSDGIVQKAGVPILCGLPHHTVATRIFNDILRCLLPMGGICVQGEDEIASIA